MTENSIHVRDCVGGIVICAVCGACKCDDCKNEVRLTVFKNLKEKGKN